MRVRDNRAHDLAPTEEIPSVEPVTDLDRLEQRLKVAFAETLVALALDDLEEDRSDHRGREDLEKHFVLRRRAVEENSILPQTRRVFAVIRQAGGEQIVVRFRRILKSD